MKKITITLMCMLLTASTAIAQKKFKRSCGVCWRRVEIFA